MRTFLIIGGRGAGKSYLACELRRAYPSCVIVDAEDTPEDVIALYGAWIDLDALIIIDTDEAAALLKLITLKGAPAFANLGPLAKILMGSMSDNPLIPEDYARRLAAAG